MNWVKPDFQSPHSQICARGVRQVLPSTSAIDTTNRASSLKTFVLSFVGAAIGVACLVGTPALYGQSIDRVLFNRDVRPILAENCFKCHGPDERQRQADLRMDRRESALDVGAIVPGDVESSALVERIQSADPAIVMPPPESQKRLTAEQKRTLRKWVEQGAEYERHWAYLAPIRPELPRGANQDEIGNPIDKYINGQLAEQKIEAAPEATPETLLRRVFLDLWGLPPSIEQQQKFLASNEKTKAYEQIVDALLESEHFGERMAPAWLDVVRYADTVGYHGDQNQNVYPYRDWVIDAFNRNMPFDRFTEYQLAGDLIESSTTESLVASCFNRLNMMTREGGAQPKEYLAKYAADRVRTVAGAWMGSTMGCAECHDHKYDPFTMRDFYSMAAFFADLKQWGVYQDYEYTPNPELRGWSNDHPFPPEIEVDVPYLRRRIETLERQRQLGAIATWSLYQDKNDAKSSFESWRSAIAAFFEQNSDGWETANATLFEPANGTKVKRMDDGALLVSGEKVESLVLSAAATKQPIAAIQIELLGLPDSPDSIFPTGQQSYAMNFVWELANADGKRTPIPMHFSDASSKAPNYFNNSQLIGIGNAWRIPAGSRPGTAAVWILNEPLRLAAGEYLVATIKGNLARRFRLRFSPLVPLDPRAPSSFGVEGANFSKKNVGSTSQLAGLARQWILTAPELADARNEIRMIESRIRECRDGRAWVQISQPQEPIATRVLPRGNWQDESGDIVSPAFPAFLTDTDDSAAPEEIAVGSTESLSEDPNEINAAKAERLTRLDLARWLVAPENPLTARVQMNRLWKHFFGAGLSPVMDDFGIQGQYPSHPELLDWLAVEFRESGWDFKHMVRLIVTSNAYRRSSQPLAEAASRDPKNTWLSHQNVRRLEAEIVRDNALAAADLLDEEIGGPPVFPYQPPGYYAQLQFPDRDYPEQLDEQRFRRGVYMHWQRTFLHPMLANFDAPPREECTGMRIEANTPLQALTLLNDPAFVEAATGLATNAIREVPSGDSDRIEWLFKRTLSRKPTSDESNSLQRFVAAQRQLFQGDPESAKQLPRTKFVHGAAEIEPVELAAWTSVCRAILNLHETITRY